jgi:hypothetical protein
MPESMSKHTSALRMRQAIANWLRCMSELVELQVAIGKEGRLGLL